MHAALFRKWKSRVKGRDFYDVQWYLAREIPVKRSYLEEKLKSSKILDETLTEKLLIELFEKRVETIDWNQARSDVLSFLKDKNQINFWSTEFFKDLIQKVKLKYYLHHQ